MGRKVVRATTGITNLAALGVGAVGAAALQSWPILALGGAAYAAMVAWDLVSGKPAKASQRQDVPRLGDAGDYSDPQIKTSVGAIVAARAEIDKALSETGPEVQAHLALALASAQELEERAASLARRAEDVARYLKRIDPRVVQADVEALARRIAQTQDPEARAQLESAQKARNEHLEVLRDLWNTRERIDATLLSIASTLEALPAKIVRMRALDAQATDQLSGDVREELERMNVEIRTFEETLKSVAEVAP